MKTAVTAAAAVVLAAAAFLTGASAARDGWLPGEAEADRQRIEAHLRGMDVVMWEVGYRHIELVNAGNDRNWPYAEYQLEKIALAIGLGVERRPKRAESARVFLEEVLPDVGRGVKLRDPAAFEAAMNRLETGCMQCHVAEEVPHFTVIRPEHRGSSIGPPPSAPDIFRP